jgi:4-methyl-5(b-hydroxyethyl)-thiazole monophosphate biosynthesis
VAATVDDDTKIKALAKSFKAQDKYLMALCAGPRFLMQAGLIEGAFTCYPGAEKDQQGGTYISNQKAVVDGKLITARSAGSVYDFVFAIIQTLKGDEALRAFQENIAY